MQTVDRWSQLLAVLSSLRALRACFLYFGLLTYAGLVIPIPRDPITQARAGPSPRWLPLGHKGERGNGQWKSDYRVAGPSGVADLHDGTFWRPTATWEPRVGATVVII